MGAICNDTIPYGETEIRYSIRRSADRQTVAITVCGPWVEVAAPAGMRAASLRRHVERKGGWILQKLDEVRHFSPIYPRVLDAGDSVRFFGRQYLLRIYYHQVRRRLEMNARQFHLYLSVDDSPQAGHALFKKLFRTHLETKLPMWLTNYSSKLGIKSPAFQVRELGNRWGSCSTSGTLRFHWLLATQHPSFVRHVVAHELCHLLEPVHSKGFFKILRKIHPSRPAPS